MIISFFQQSPPTTAPSAQPSLPPVEKKRKTLGRFFKAAKGNEAAAPSDVYSQENDVDMELGSYLLTNQIKSLLLSHHHSTSALVSEILMSVLQTVQKNNNNNLHMDSTYLQTV